MYPVTSFGLFCELKRWRSSSFTAFREEEKMWLDNMPEKDLAKLNVVSSCVHSAKDKKFHY